MRAATRFTIFKALFGAMIIASAAFSVSPAEAQMAHPIRLPAVQHGNGGDAVNDRDLQCLARNIYWEAGGEPEVGKVAVAAVTLNRARHGAYPSSVCGVVYQGAGRSCQFSWACNGRRNQAPSGVRWQRSVDVAYRVLSGDMDDPTNGALYFHGLRERPSWSRQRTRTTRLGGHIFYR